MSNSSEMKKDKGDNKKKVQAAAVAAVLGLSPMAAKSSADVSMLEKPPQVTTELPMKEKASSQEQYKLSIESLENSEDEAEQKRLSIEQEHKEQRSKDAQSYLDLLEEVKQHDANVGKFDNDLERRLAGERARLDGSLPDIGSKTVREDFETSSPDIHRIDVTNRNVDEVVVAFKKDFGIDAALDKTQTEVAEFIDTSETMNTVTKAMGVNKIVETLRDSVGTLKNMNEEELRYRVDVNRAELNAQIEKSQEIIGEFHELTDVEKEQVKEDVGNVLNAISEATPGKLLAAAGAVGADAVLNREINRFILKAIENSRNSISPNTVSLDTRFQQGFDVRHPDNMLLQKSFSIEDGDKKKTEDDWNIKIGGDPFDKSVGMVIEKKF